MTKTQTFTFRGKAEMRDRLQNAADNAERSLSEEIERRLDQSFRQDADIRAAIEMVRVKWDRY